MRILITIHMLGLGCALWSAPTLSWRWSNPQPSGDNLIFAAYTGPDRELVVADNGAVFESADGGNGWKDRGGRIADDYLIAARVSESGVLLAVSGFGRVWRSTDGGLHWRIAGEFPSTLVQIGLCGDGIALAVGTEGTIIRSADQGATWTLARSDTLGTFLLGVHCAGRRAVVVGESGTVLRSDDGGMHWDSLPPPVAEYLTGVAFSESETDREHGIAITDRGRVAETRDGGRSWRVTVLDSVAYLGGISSAGSSWRINGSEGGIWTSRDNGSTWARAAAPTTANLTSTAFISGKAGIAVGANGLILHESGPDGAWKIVRKGPTLFVDGLAILSRDEWLAFGSPGLLLRTQDGGSTWKQQAVLPDTVRFLSGAFKGPVGLLAGDSGTIARTEDGGHTWSTAPTPRRDVRLFGIAWIDSSADIAVAVGQAGSLWRTTDGGRTWAAMANPPGTGETALSAVAFPGNGTGFAVGYDGVMLRTSDSGATWVRVSTSADQNLYGISFRDRRTGIAVGGYGLLLVTRDGGDTWTRQSLGFEEDYIFGSTWLGGDTVLAVGDWGHGWFMAISTDAGTNWSDLRIPTRKSLWYVSSLGMGRVALTGQDGAILIGTLQSGFPGGGNPGGADDAFFSVRRRVSSADLLFRVDLAAERTLTLRAFGFDGRERGVLYRGTLGTGAHSLILPYRSRGPTVFRLEANGPSGRIIRSEALAY